MADDVSDLIAVLHKLRDDTWDRCVTASGRAKKWSQWSVALAAVATIGSGAAGATVAAGSLSSGTRAVVAILAFAGAGLSGISAAIGAPGQAKTEQLKSDRLAALTRWADVALVNMPQMDRPNAEIRVRDFLVWRDDIQGVAAPLAVRSPNPIEPSPDPVSGDDDSGAGTAKKTTAEKQATKQHATKQQAATKQPATKAAVRSPAGVLGPELHRQ